MCRTCGRKSPGRSTALRRASPQSRCDVTAANSDRETLQKLVEIADRGCIMMNTLRGKLEVRIEVEPAR